VAGGAANHARRPAPLLGPGDHHGADDGHGLWPGAAATEGLIGSVIGLFGLDLAVPDHSTLSRRAKTLEVPPLRRTGSGSLHLLVDSTGLELGGAGEWLVEKHGTSRRRSWRKLHIGVDADSGEIVAVEVTRKDIDDTAMAGALLGQIADPIASFTADGSYDQDQVCQAVAERHPDAGVIVPPRAGAVASASAETAPTQRGRHLRMIAERGRMAWQKASGYNLRAKVEASIGRYKRVIGDALRSRTDQTEATEVAIAAAALNRMLAFGRPNCRRRCGWRRPARSGSPEWLSPIRPPVRTP
jgi:Transposase DDE domain